MFHIEQLNRKFDRMGARLQHIELLRGRSVTLDIGDERGGLFDLRLAPELIPFIDATVLDVRPEMRHLLLMLKNLPDRPGQKPKFLCGHDERFWFVAAVPPGAVSTVPQAMEALKPAVAIASQRRAGVKRRDANRRRNAGFVRQGEWFFLPAPELEVPTAAVLRNEPLSRGVGSKPHWAELLYRQGGQRVYVSRRFPRGLSPSAYARHVAHHPGSEKLFRLMVRDPTVYVKGTIRHPDHKTVKLRFWHRVVMNTEGSAPWAGNVTFLD